MATIVQGVRPRWADMYDSSQEQDSQPMDRNLLHQDSYQESQASQVCTQGGLCDQLQSKTELEDTAQDRKAGIVRRKHLEEISDDEDGPARGQKRTVSTAAEASTPATKRQRSFPEGSPAATVLDPASPGPSAPDAGATMEAEMETAVDNSTAVEAEVEGGMETAVDISTAVEAEMEGGMETAVDNSTAVEAEVEGGMETAVDNSTAVEAEVEGGMETAVDNSTAVEAEVEGGMETAVDNSTAVEAEVEGGMETAVDNSTAVEAEVEGGMETAVDNSSAVEAEVEGGVADAADAPFSPEGDGEEPEGERRLRKRIKLISMHKDRPEYQAFNARFPRHLRHEGQPMTPDPRAYPSKRQWETAAQKWREELRLATCGMVEFPAEV